MNIMRSTVEQVRCLQVGLSNESIGRCMVLAGLELWREAIGPERLAVHLAAMARGLERDARLEADTFPQPPLAH